MKNLVLQIVAGCFVSLTLSVYSSSAQPASIPSADGGRLRIDGSPVHPRESTAGKTNAEIASPPTPFPFHVIYSWGPSNGFAGYGGGSIGLVTGAKGELYGVTEYGGTMHRGTIFKLTLENHDRSGWKRTILHSFDNRHGNPTAGLSLDSHGALYGTTSEGAGSVFKLVRHGASGAWVMSIIYDFASEGGGLGSGPAAGVIVDAHGAVYGTTYAGGDSQKGTVFRLDPPKTPGGEWTKTILHSFSGIHGDGASPQASLMTDQSGALYGTTLFGGSGACDNVPPWNSGCGTAFKLTPPSMAGGPWRETVLYNFQGDLGGAHPTSALVADAHGALFGTTLSGGLQGLACRADGCGTVYRLTAPATSEASWTGTVLHSFTGKPDGQFGADKAPGVAVDGSGAVYGTTPVGGSGNLKPGYGVVFKLTPPATAEGVWVETILHSFTNRNGDGGVPVEGTVLISDDRLYGSTSEGGGPLNLGTVFELRLAR